MGATADHGVATFSTTAIVIRRLRREDCRHTKHDSAFSNWKILIGPSDWQDHAQGKEGAEKYRVKNLPNCTSCPGVYELGIVLSRRQSGREISKIDPDFIIPVYLGKSDNVRNRLQQYGRDGAHLENGSSNCKLNDCNNILTGKGPGPGLFSEIFTKGFSLVYRWVPMTNAKEAEKTEVELLGTFDYAWNKGSNGPRRQNDILKRIDRISKTPQFLQKLQLFPQRRKGIKIRACRPQLLEDAYDFNTDFPPDNFFSRVLKFGRSRPMLVPWRSETEEYYPSICGVALGHGIVCRKPPSERRKRCADHKGMKINAASSKLLVETKFNLPADMHLAEKNIAPVCGFILHDGSSCIMEPVQGNKRCPEHKGRKIFYPCPPSLLVEVEKEHSHVYPILDHKNNQNILSKKAGRLNTSSGQQVAKNGNTTCGIGLKDGTFCTRQPPRGRKRCEEHKGKRVKVGLKSFSDLPYVFDSSGSHSYSGEENQDNTFLPSFIPDKISPTCGMTLQNGGFCKRIPVKGNQRCWQHKNRRVEQNHAFTFFMDDKIS